MRGLSERLAQDSGRLYSATCSADLGDARCTVDLTDAAFRGNGAVVALSAISSFTASGLDGFDGGQVVIDGQDLSKMSDRARTAYRSRQIGFVNRAGAQTSWRDGLDVGSRAGWIMN